MSWVAHLWDFCWQWYFAHGVPGNLAASAILGVPTAYEFHKRLWQKHLKPHMDRTKEIHNHLNPDHPFTLGGNNGESSTRG